jgi:FkbH-like protein
MPESKPARDWVSDASPALPGNLADLISEAAGLELELNESAPIIRIGFLRNITIEGIEPYLRFRLLSDGFKPSLWFGGYGSMIQDVLQPNSRLREHSVDILITAIMLEELDPDYGLPKWTAKRAREELVGLVKALEASDAPQIVLNTFLLPFYSQVGFATSSETPDITGEVESLNHFLQDWVQKHGPRFCLIDWNQIARRVGESGTCDYRYWYMKKAPFKRDFLDLMSIQIRRIVRALEGRSKKCLVLDCDNTLWGGIVGEDGIDGIQLDGHDYPGRVFYDFQKTVLQLVERGVLVLICSKNNEQDVFEVLDEHPWCLLKRSHIAAFRINWNDKAQNLTELASELNLGLDSFVFVDDNPRELALVKQLLPDVTVLPVPERLHDFPRVLLDDDWFDNLSLASEDGQRTRLYQEEKLRKSEKERHSDLERYLESLRQTVQIHVASEGEIQRVAQLTRKTNQFNLTTRRYADYEIEQLCRAAHARVYTLSASDRFGSLGLVGVLIVLRRETTAIVDTLLMSCRALGRQLEIIFVDVCMKEIADDWDVSRWEASYIRTDKNSQVADFWDRLGFARVKEEDGGARYELLADQPGIPTPKFITIKS